MDSPAQTAPHPRPPLPLPPNPEHLLLTALQRRDSQSCRRLTERLVHRRGVGALQHFLDHSLAASEADDARGWLQGLLAAAPTLPARELSASPGDPLPQQQLPLDHEQAVEADVDAAIAAMLATFPAEQLAQLPPQQAFARLEQLDPADLGRSDSAALECSAPPAELLVDPEFQGLAAPEALLTPPPPTDLESLDGCAAEAAAPLSFRIEPRSAEAVEQDTSHPMVVSAQRDSSEPEQASAEASEGDGEPGRWAEALRERLRRRLPRAARAMKKVLAANPWPASWWQPADGDETEAHEQDLTLAMEEEALWGDCEALTSAGPEGDPPSLVHQEPAHPQSASLRLMQRLSERGEAATAAADSPAPRPASLAELRAWLPETRLPHAS